MRSNRVWASQTDHFFGGEEQRPHLPLQHTVKFHAYICSATTRLNTVRGRLLYRQYEWGPAPVPIVHFYMNAFQLSTRNTEITS